MHRVSVRATEYDHRTRYVTASRTFQSKPPRCSVTLQSSPGVLCAAARLPPCVAPSVVPSSRQSVGPRNPALLAAGTQERLKRVRVQKLHRTQAGQRKSVVARACVGGHTHPGWESSTACRQPLRSVQPRLQTARTDYTKLLHKMSD